MLGLLGNSDIMRGMHGYFDRVGHYATLKDYHSADKDSRELWRVEVDFVIEMTEEEFQAFASGLRRHWAFLLGRGGIASTAEGDWRAKPRGEWTLEETEAFNKGAFRRVVEVRGPRATIYVDSQRSNHVKYVGFPELTCPACTRPTARGTGCGCDFDHFNMILETKQTERNLPACVGAYDHEHSLEQAKAANIILSLTHDPDMSTKPVALVVAPKLERMTHADLAKGSYHPKGKLCAYCGEIRGREGVCKACELACGDPCSRCDTGLGPNKHCPCCSPCGTTLVTLEPGEMVVPLKMLGTVTGRLSSKSPVYSNQPRTGDDVAPEYDFSGGVRGKYAKPTPPECLLCEAIHHEAPEEELATMAHTCGATNKAPEVSLEGLCQRAKDAVAAGLISLEKALASNGLIAAGLMSFEEDEDEDDF